MREGHGRRDGKGAWLAAWVGGEGTRADPREAGAPTCALSTEAKGSCSTRPASTSLANPACEHQDKGRPNRPRPG